MNRTPFTLSLYAAVFLLLPALETRAQRSPRLDTKPEWIRSNELPGQRHAILIGVGKYHDDAFPDLSWVENDLTFLRENLQRAGFRDDHIQTLLDLEVNQSHLRGIATQLNEDLPSLGSSTKHHVLIWWSGHGYVDENDIVQYPLTQTYARSKKIIGENAIANHELKSIFKALKQRSDVSVTYIIDTCQSLQNKGRFNNDSKVTPDKLKADVEIYGAEYGTEGFPNVGNKLSLFCEAFVFGFDKWLKSPGRPCTYKQLQLNALERIENHPEVSVRGKQSPTHFGDEGLAFVDPFNIPFQVRVMDARTKDLIPDAKVIFGKQPPTDSGTLLKMSAKTYQAEIQAEGYFPTKVTIDLDIHKWASRLDVFLDPEFITLRGKVLGTDGKDKRGVTVRVADYDAARPNYDITRTTTDKNGEYFLRVRALERATVVAGTESSQAFSLSEQKTTTAPDGSRVFHLSSIAVDANAAPNWPSAKRRDFDDLIKQAIRQFESGNLERSYAKMSELFAKHDLNAPLDVLECQADLGRRLALEITIDVRSLTGRRQQEEFKQAYLLWPENSDNELLIPDISGAKEFVALAHRTQDLIADWESLLQRDLRTRLETHEQLVAIDSSERTLSSHFHLKLRIKRLDESIRREVTALQSKATQALNQKDSGGLPRYDSLVPVATLLSELPESVSSLPRRNRASELATFVTSCHQQWRVKLQDLSTKLLEGLKNPDHGNIATFAAWLSQIEECTEREPGLEPSFEYLRSSIEELLGKEIGLGESRAYARNLRGLAEIEVLLSEKSASMNGQKALHRDTRDWLKITSLTRAGQIANAVSRANGNESLIEGVTESLPLIKAINNSEAPREGSLNDLDLHLESMLRRVQELVSTLKNQESRASSIGKSGSKNDDDPVSVLAHRLQGPYFSGFSEREFDEFEAPLRHPRKLVEKLKQGGTGSAEIAKILEEIDYFYFDEALKHSVKESGLKKALAKFRKKRKKSSVSPGQLLHFKIRELDYRFAKLLGTRSSSKRTKNLEDLADDYTALYDRTVGQDTRDDRGMSCRAWALFRGAKCAGFANQAFRKEQLKDLLKKNHPNERHYKLGVPFHELF